MAEIRPIRGWRYHSKFTDRIETLTSPLFDVISHKQREELYLNPLNSIHLSVPKGINDAHRTLVDWKEDSTLERDSIPGIYVYYQYFSLPGLDHELVRKGFVCNIRIYDWDEKVILRHESTIPGSVNDRIENLKHTELNVSPTHGLYTDTQKEIEKYLDEAISFPIYEVEDYQGVRDVFSVIHDRNIILRIIEILKEKQIILADGHHRYESSLTYKKLKKKENKNHDGSEAYNYHMMYLTNTESDDLRVLPTHRVFNDFRDISEKELLRRIEKDFIIKEVANAPDVNDIILGKKWAFGLLIGDNAYKIRLKPEKFETIPTTIPEAVRELDLSVLHYFFVEKVLGIPYSEQSASSKIKYERNFTECLKEVIKGEAQFAIITKEIPIDKIKEVCYSGFTLPQKSTYFYPKVISGFIFSSINENEFKGRIDTCF